MEKALDECLERLKGRLETDFYDDFDDLDSIASAGVGSATASLSNRVVRFTVQERQVEKLQAKLSEVEKENAMLRDEVIGLKNRLLALGDDDDTEEENKGEDTTFAHIELSERGGWNTVKQLAFTNTDES